MPELPPTVGELPAPPLPLLAPLPPPAPPSPFGATPFESQCNANSDAKNTDEIETFLLRGTMVYCKGDRLRRRDP
jgi:hypothetical protein